MNEAMSMLNQNVRLGDDYVPVIDISPYFNGGEEAKRHVATEIGQACRKVGFYIIVGHGVPEAMEPHRQGRAAASREGPACGERRS